MCLSETEVRSGAIHRMMLIGATVAACSNSASSTAPAPCPVCTGSQTCVVACTGDGGSTPECVVQDSTGQYHKGNLDGGVVQSCAGF